MARLTGVSYVDDDRTPTGDEPSDERLEAREQYRRRTIEFLACKKMKNR